MTLADRAKTINSLVLGLDRRPEEPIGRPDVIILAHFDLQRKQAALLSIPRDLIVAIPGYGRNRINAAYVYGAVGGRREGGIGLLRRAIEQNFGIRIDHYAVLDFNCFTTLIDAIGGITVDVPYRLVDPYYPAGVNRYRTVVFDSGPQRMSGARALEYVRTRSTSNDFARMHRQQQVIWAIRARLLNPGILPSLPSVVGSCGGLQTDVGVANMASLALAVKDIQSNDIAVRVIEPPMVEDYISPLGAMMLQPRWELIRPLVRSVFPSATWSSGAAGVSPRSEDAVE